MLHDEVTKIEHTPALKMAGDVNGNKMERHDELRGRDG